MARRTFSQHGGDKHFREFEENALYLPEHAPETFDFILKWMYQKHLGIAEYCKVLFATHNKSREGLEAAILLLCRVYILADYLSIEEIMDPVMRDFTEAMLLNRDTDFSPIGPHTVTVVFQKTPEHSQLQRRVIQNLAESFVLNTNGRPIEDYAQCFHEIEGFGASILERVLYLHETSYTGTEW